MTNNENYKVEERSLENIEKHGSIELAIKHLEDELESALDSWGTYSGDSLGHLIICNRLIIDHLKDLADKKLSSFMDNLIIGGFPKSREIKNEYSECNVIINVSDQFYLGNSEEQNLLGKMNFYFPMGESGDDMGLNSLYGGLQVLHQIYTHDPDWKVLIHCQAGRNRSPLLKSAFKFMMSGEHDEDSRLLYNISKGHLPDITKMESFLKNCKFAFVNSHCFFGGQYDWVMRKSNCSLK